jgi:hypothetical protein
MVIKVLVHPRTPLCRRKFAEETMGMFRATMGARGGESINQANQSRSFFYEVTFLAHNEALVRWGVLLHGILV